MKPAFSVIFLTTLLGAGQGLFLALFTHQSYALFGLLPMQSDAFYGYGSALALLFLGGGLIASFFHLGRPERAWRSATQWRTSWLSREVIVLPAFMGVVFLYGAAHLAGYRPAIVTLPTGLVIDLSTVIGVIGTLLSFALFVCTGMIYACLRFLREWNSPLTVINYILLGGSSGFILASFYASSAAPAQTHFFVGWSIIITVLAFVGRGASLVRNARLKPKSTIQTAIGIKHPNIVQRSMGFMGGSFNTREFFHGKSPAFMRTIKPIFLLLAFVVPLALLAIGMFTPSMLAFAFILQYIGLLAERWFFFAQANHPQNLYYQCVS
ncbi:dimethyl sulfoxide reductase anchor subunit family protein [Sideroxydans lithotrophicus]|uniref:DMSO reductase anchor subunit (DmsC) n=1 Tax=Sideroxydans lithotrophicus (strain ES-1) TaxID=580332 RepID=D5CSK6_SIDLE|nr:DmsC/YnfH family molybdoenzyme membrane anchor subunit [Sideroxydans lithotrophicus]ADE11942.1 DMSO reductase anchor subunit (DmsC) [Sideroxydans lithotrophicus ES-1]